MTNEKRLSVEEAAAALGKHSVTVRRLIAAGTLPAVREAGRVFIPAAAVEAAARKVCPHCGKPFTPERYATRGRFCSDACRWAATYQARKAANPSSRGPGRPPAETPKTPRPRSVPARLATIIAHLPLRMSRNAL